MQRRIAVLIVGLALVSVARSDETLKCYMCTSLTNPHCASNPKEGNVKLVECTLLQMDQWKQNFQGHNISSVISHIFDVDHSWAIANYHPGPMACAKMVLTVRNEEVVVRNCQIAKAENIDPCKSIQGKMNTDFSSLKHCDLCMENACNTSTGLSPRIFVILLFLVGTVILGGFYNGA